MISTYFGKITIVLKFPLTSAASAKGEQRNRGLPFGVWVLGEGEREVPICAFGVGDLRRGLRLRPENMFGIQGMWRRAAKVVSMAMDKNGTKSDGFGIFIICDMTDDYVPIFK
jgi:hypothetical protein